MAGKNKAAMVAAKKKAALEAETAKAGLKLVAAPPVEEVEQEETDAVVEESEDTEVGAQEGAEGKVAAAPGQNPLPKLPSLKRARKPKPPQPCACGCGGMTAGGKFMPGHDARLHGWVLRVQRGIVTLAQVEESDGAGVRKAVAAHMAAVEAGK